MESNISISSFMNYPFGVVSKNSLPSPRTQRLSPMYPSSSFIVLDFTFRSVLDFCYFFCIVKVMDQSVWVCMCVCYFQLFQYYFMKRLFLTELPLYHVDNWLLRCVRVYCQFLFYFIDLFVYLYKNTTLCWLFSS